MKKLFYAALFLGAFVFANPANAQINVSFNIGVQPNWGPVGYDYARYYYIPEIDVYYDVSNRYYHYYDGRRWARQRSLPGRYGHVDLYRTYKVVINDSNPWRNHRSYYDRYHRYSRNYSQVNLRDGRGNNKYYKDREKHYRKMEKERNKYHKKMDKHYRKHRGRD
ncbi:MULTISPECIES: hypothetical protein [Sphingobacterium]|uniref:DUF3300 domain-containing protein n=1 Tax=Sphingobacterium tenebrionis TaxID=3111775 RepID=A0ABU8I331_9SPHI|nr:hypothetical protein [Sphingobacterium sp. CZ-2]QBR11713.1 hypothetical protein E3D81_05810 [Sphingobacterium sp. CZ-2]